MKKNGTMRTTTECARLYAGQQKEIGILLGRIAKGLRAHGKATATNPGNWGYVGDLGHVRESLKEIADFIRA